MSLFDAYSDMHDENQAAALAALRMRDRPLHDALVRLLVADEISPDSCRLWDVKTGQKLDKDVFRRDLGNLTDAYTEVARRLGVMPAAAPVKPTLIN
mgnify:CR=1 FL=1